MCVHVLVCVCVAVSVGACVAGGGWGCMRVSVCARVSGGGGGATGFGSRCTTAPHPNVHIPAQGHATHPHACMHTREHACACTQHTHTHTFALPRSLLKSCQPSPPPPPSLTPPLPPPPPHQISLVSQEPSIFAGTILRNIQMGRCGTLYGTIWNTRYSIMYGTMLW